jgi:cbb3-type cytochrome oxidase subunit 3
MSFSFRRALGAACIASAATAGLLVGAGRREGDSRGAFLRAGRALLDSRGAGDLLVPDAAMLIGMLHHIGAVVLWGTLIAFVAGALRPVLRIVVVAAATVVLAWAGSSTLPVLGRVDLPAALALRWPLHAALGLTLLVGLWIMRPSRRTHRDHTTGT